MEKEFDRVERIIGKELTLEAAYFYYDFYDLAHELKHEIKALDLKLSMDHNACLEKLRYGQDLYQEMDRLSLCKLLLAAVVIDQYNHGFFERKMKDKTIVRLLKALQLSFR
ncbi:hypothetical protein QWY93_17055 [Echinicola jeungdonensis]|uniref:Uncharacterized protein n=1 Tax=Echinicola jeungdonensis TaxID=709343 RepID=A0ABV5J5Q2_9BACT|nr:hypothetical protein [Echinicola jeungdonensis]MDN3671025.1 hypothetical protein [Echinicola jeungdonensis]